MFERGPIFIYKYIHSNLIIRTYREIGCVEQRWSIVISIAKAYLLVQFIFTRYIYFFFFILTECFGTSSFHFAYSFHPSPYCYCVCFSIQLLILLPVLCSITFLNWIWFSWLIHCFFSRNRLLNWISLVYIFIYLYACKWSQAYNLYLIRKTILMNGNKWE